MRWNLHGLLVYSMIVKPVKIPVFKKKIQGGQLPEELTSAVHTQRKRDNKKMAKVLGTEAGRHHCESRQRTCRQDAQEKTKEN